MHYYYLLAIKFFIGFLFIIGYFNLSGKTQISQLTPIDLFGNFVLGGIVGGITYNESIPLHQYTLVLVIGIFILFCFNFIAKRFSIFRKFTSGEPIPIIKNKQFLIENILKKKNKIDMINIIAQLRVRGIYDLDKITYSQIESDGQLTVSCGKNQIPGEIVVHNGEIISSALKRIDKNQTWMRDNINKTGINKKNIFICHISKQSMMFIMRDGAIKKITYDD